MSEKQQVYLPNLQGLRAIAACIVLAWHVYQFFPSFGLSGEHDDVASVAVTLFFVLSGFLITFLLLREKELFGNISIKQFYIRRILRIWPLYYFAVLLSLLLLPFLDGVEAPRELFFPYLAYFLLFPNLPFVFQCTVSLITPLWSIGIEEQFYAFWPWLVRKSKSLPWVILFCCCLFILPKIYFRITLNETGFSYFASSRIQCMALGAYGAFWLQNGQAYRTILFHPVSQLLCWLVFLYSAVLGALPIPSVFLHEVYALVFFVIILNVSSNPKNLVNLEYGLLRFLGEISYGIYVYHMFVLLITAHFLRDFFTDTYGDKILIYLLVFSGTIAVAWLSYRFFELPFLRRKSKYGRIQSGSNVNPKEK